ncbi:hypothetical protein Tco_1040915 [Tanacetum coccineum]|uniref:Uncharacterized protein n=1 Tax=Tanacetum coccineum TaxID=301880 RepID=A0ABQ5GG64_9ASTR
MHVCEERWEAEEDTTRKQLALNCLLRHSFRVPIFLCENALYMTLEHKACISPQNCKGKKTNIRSGFAIMKRYLAFGRHLEEIHVTWAHLEKKQTRLQTYTNISQDYVLRCWRRRHKMHVTPSQFIP